ncbi:ATP-binding/permease protein CydD [Leminorella richardii]|uniref:ATP-binding/permease protein CydD n=1 Tax=Leminorella richardii TaxID=158841 RepID=A0A2X4UI70_9GAMM|nr:ATP-binding/permease protein CydD [Leminorella richardii]
MLLGFLPYRGSITVNGTELSALSPSQWRQQISWVGQNPHLPARTIRENIALSAPQASDEQIAKAANRAYIDEFLSRFPDGLDTEVGDSAARLSVGQAQRVAVARALMSPCCLLLLDEPTASLDANSERLVMSALNNASTQQTTLLVTHRLEDASHYHDVWVMDKGMIVQQGDYPTLSCTPGPFADLLSNRSVEV